MILYNTIICVICDGQTWWRKTIPMMVTAEASSKKGHSIQVDSLALLLSQGDRLHIEVCGASFSFIPRGSQPPQDEGEILSKLLLVRLGGYDNSTVDSVELSNYQYII